LGILPCSDEIEFQPRFSAYNELIEYTTLIGLHRVIYEKFIFYTISSI
jgi:hypothetical protein